MSAMIKKHRVSLLAFGLLLCLGLTASATRAETPASSTKEGNTNVTTPATAPNAGCDLNGSIVPGANGALGVNILYEVSAVAPDDIWAVGTASGYLSFPQTRGYVQHWDGTQWSIVHSQNGALYSIDALSANDVWAVGTAGGPINNITTLAIHWNGTAWTTTSTPNIPGNYNGLQGVSAASANDVWAVGWYSASGSTGPLALHWDGAQWSISYSGTQGGRFNEVAAIAANDVWAVGLAPGGQAPLAMHWDGSVWTATPVPGGASNSLTAVSAVSGNDVWAVGGGQWVVHWDGTAWSQIPAPTARPSYFADVVAISANNVWLAGTQYTGNLGDPLLMHWDGNGWTETLLPRTGSDNNSLEGIAVIAPDEAWGVGSYRVNRQAQTLTQHLSGGRWAQVASPNVPLGYNTFRSIDAISPDDMWAVGHYGYEHYGGYPYFWPATLTAHWDGQRWNHVPSPNETAEDFGGRNYLEAVEAVSENDVWAVGHAVTSNSFALVLHWNGSVWTKSLGSQHAVSGHLYGISAASANDVWAVGDYYHYQSGSVQALVMHWNGTAWSVVNTPALRPEAHLWDVDVVSANDVWAVGTQKLTNPGTEQTFIMHWNGAEWSVVYSPNQGTAPNYLNAVAAASASEVWAVGSYIDASGMNNTLILRWNGSTWSIVPSPNMGTNNVLRDVADAGPGNAWAVGRRNNGTTDQTLAMRWDGNMWSIVPSPNAGAEANYLNGVTMLSYYEAVAVGEYFTGDVTRTLTERFTPTSFTDVPPDNAFYQYVLCMACRGILSGYQDGTFRPNNEVTRGQLSKIVSNSAGFNEPPGSQLFEDVPPGSTFYDWVNRLAGRGHISGYPCGEVGEPCGVRNLPYFRPNSNATRGQISKIVSNAAGYNETPAGQTFEDVPTTHAFYLWIERLASRGHMSGYPCGAPGEPCGPGNRPYFRPQNNATRGQTSKIVANTFFPNCQPVMRR